MKKTLAFMAAAAMLLATVSCTKEGVYNPKEKIADIHQSVLYTTTSSYAGTNVTETDTTPKHMTEKWDWDGKLLSSISYYSYNRTTKESEFSYKLSMTYDGKKLTKVAESNETYTVYSYDGSLINKMEEFYEGKLVRTYDITHDGKKIVKIVVTHVDEEGLTKSAEYALGMLLPSSRALDILRRSSKDGASNTQTIDLTNDGGNVTKMVMTFGNETYTAEFTFDKKKNPFYGCYANMGDGGVSFLNENNVLTEKTTWAQNGSADESETTTYTYEYDGKYPVSVSYSNTSSQGEYYTSTRTYTTYYEYED
ncbi:MAG: hypothetical protein K5867_10575 [Bacteroidales bacterium]|nr:hypothetical protein [Bacteroidales bacterium]